MANVGTVTFDLAAEAAKLRSELEKVRRDVSGLRQTGRDMGDAITSGFNFARQALGAFGIALGGAALVQGFVRIAGAAIEAGDEIGKAASKAGIAASAMSELAYAAKQNDVEINALSTSIRKMQEVTSLAADGNKAATQTIESLGLSVTVLRQLRPDQQFEAFAEAISRIPDPADRARLAVDVFGRTGAELLPLMEQGAAGVRNLRREAVALGVAMSDDQVERLQKVDEQVKKLSASFSALASTLVAKVAPALTGFLDGVRIAINGTELEVLQRDIRKLKLALSTMRNDGGDAVVRRQLEEQLAEKRAEERRLKERATPARSLGETRGSRPMEIGAATVGAGAGAATGTSTLDAWLASRGGAGSGMAGPSGGGRMVMRNGRLVFETDEQAAGLDAMGNEAALEAQRAMNERRLELERELTAQTVVEVGNRESLIAELVRGSEETQNAYRVAANMSWGEIINSGIALAASGNKRVAKINQGLAIASTVWSTSAAIMDVMGPRGPGFPANLAAAAKIAAMGAIQVAKIRSTGYSEGGGGGSIASVGGGDTGGAVADRAGASAPLQEVQAARPQATIIVQGNIMSTRESAEWFIEQVRDAVVDRDVVLIPSNSRQALELAGVGA